MPEDLIQEFVNYVLRKIENSGHEIPEGLTVGGETATDLEDFAIKLAENLRSASSGGASTLAQVLALGNNANGLEIVNAADPTTDQSLATKKYVDDNSSPGGGSSYFSFKGLLNQVEPTILPSGELIVGATYTIENYTAPDDFSNVADVQSGTINTHGCVFIATGRVPTTFENGTTLTQSGVPFVTELQNDIGVMTYTRPNKGTIFVTFPEPIPYGKLFVPNSTADESNYSLLFLAGNQAVGIKGYIAVYLYNTSFRGDFSALEIDITDVNKQPCELQDLVANFPLEFYVFP